MSRAGRAIAESLPPLVLAPREPQPRESLDALARSDDGAALLAAVCEMERRMERAEAESERLVSVGEDLLDVIQTCEARIAEQDAEIARLRALLRESRAAADRISSALILGRLGAMHSS